MGARRLVGLVAVVAAAFVSGTSWAQPQPAANAVRTIFLDATGETFSVPSPVVYHPGVDRYYGADSGNTSVPGFVFGPTGGLPLQTLTPLNIDPRGWNFNPNTGLLEVVSFDAVTGGAGEGLIESRIDSSGMLTGVAVSLLPSMPGNSGSQTSPAYDPVEDVFYSRSSTNAVNVVRRSDGALAGTVVLDFTAAGMAAALNDGITFVPVLRWLVVLDGTGSRAVAFDRHGRFVGESALDITVTTTARRPGYANGQLFVFDGARNGWQGYQIVDVACATDADCDDDNLCTDDACDGDFQCGHTDNTLPCSDGDSCSSNDACSGGTCVASPAGYEGIACLLHRLKAPDLCTDAVPVSLRRAIGKRLGKAQRLIDAAEAQGGNAQLRTKARILIDGVSTSADKAAVARSAGKRISAECAATIRSRAEAVSALLNAL